MFCSKCGKEIEQNMQFCIHCGNKVSFPSSTESYENKVDLSSSTKKSNSKVKKKRAPTGIILLLLIIGMIAIIVISNIIVTNNAKNMGKNADYYEATGEFDKFKIQKMKISQETANKINDESFNYDKIQQLLYGSKRDYQEYPSIGYSYNWYDEVGNYITIMFNTKDIVVSAKYYSSNN